MPVFLAPLLLKLVPIRAFIKAHIELIVFAVAALALVGSSIFLYSRGHEAGQKAVEVQVERQHTETIREVRSDQQLAQDVADKTGATLSNTIDQQRSSTDAQLKEIHDAVAAMPVAPIVCPAVPDSVRASSNALIDRANRAAGDADAAR